MSRNGCWGSFVVADARHAVTLPAELPPGAAAAVPTASATAWYSLHDLARIMPADKVLIHCGTGGVGMSAIAIARSAGCEIFATAGSPERRQLLRDMGIEHVYDSRGLEFGDEIRRDTDGYGVDVVLNSLSGASRRAGIELLAAGGRFVELGEHDMYRDANLGLFSLRRNLSLFAVDLTLLMSSHPDTIRRLLTTVYERTAAGELPAPLTTHYPVSDAGAALRLVGAAGHTGKVVLDMPQSGSCVAVVPPEQTHPFRADGAYLITGGVGGLGLFLAGEMAARDGKAGCGRIVLNSLSAPTEQERQAIERLRETGADIRVECGDIAEPATAARLVACRDRVRITRARRAARGGGRRGCDVDQRQRRTDGPLLGAKGLRRLEPARGDSGAATGLVLFIFVGGRVGGFSGPGRVCRGQQLVGRVRALAS